MPAAIGPPANRQQTSASPPANTISRRSDTTPDPKAQAAHTISILSSRLWRNGFRTMANLKCNVAQRV
ncbi:hypothetical protein SEA_GATTACA_115 [Mycobacterium phage Gattaca]|uniref:Uncharacterized protein n=1 Tax=Mycobacterium phage Gattaca TaxID=1852567 RepID=A0A192Y9U2_9CAUD|nr:hypothetical protein SEA_GATTACA_115 [Mycobacterium phage Gattaca]